jgi:GH25 family lysozyme M1 (1,4-beta-N-acetylmuramidase)
MRRLTWSTACLAGALAFVALCADACDSVEQSPLETTRLAVKVCAGPETVPGIDVSKWQTDINWKKVADAGYRFANIRVSNGTTLDAYFEKNRTGAKANGLITGAYHFFQPDIDAAAQANFVVQHVGPLGPDDLPVTLDLEWADGGNPTVSMIQTWVDIVAEGTGKVPMVYTSAGYWNQYFNGQFSQLPLWVAHWGTECPNLPNSWTEWWFWQPGGGPVPGVPGDIVDKNYFNGNLQDLQNFAAGGLLAGCGGPQMVACGRVGCTCADGECSGAFCDGTGCSAQETADCDAYGCLCVDHQCSGGLCEGNGCTAKETTQCEELGCGCQDHQCTGGPCAPCQPACDGKQCGDDGCGGSCGSCTGPSACTDGKCLCAPSCHGKQCGDDGCGGSCGACPQQAYCQAGICYEGQCVPQCAGRECGDDGCGGSCGSCGDGEQCLLDPAKATAWCASCPDGLPCADSDLWGQPDAAGEEDASGGPGPLAGRGADGCSGRAGGPLPSPATGGLLLLLVIAIGARRNPTLRTPRPHCRVRNF